jgi:hypothetical protein
VITSFLPLMRFVDRDGTLIGGAAEASNPGQGDQK